MRSLKQKNKAFFNRIARYYDSFGFIKIHKRIIKIITIKKNSKILDAGCGTGNLLFLLKKQNKNLKLYGIDISEEMLKIARKKLKEKANLKLLAVEELDRKNYFDYAFSVDSFHHYYNQNIAMRNFYIVLKKKGKLVVVDFDFGFLNWFFHVIEPGNRKMNPASELKNLFEGYNFKNIKQKRIGLFSVLTLGKK